MSSVVIAGNTSGSVTLDAPAVAGTTVLTLPATSGTVIVGTAGVTSVASGGTGAATLTADNVILGNGTSAVQFVAPGSSGNVLTSNGTTWTSAAAAGGQLQTELFTAPGTWTKPASCTQVRVTVVGGGAGGQPARSGGVGGFAIATNIPVSAPVTITVGAGGNSPGGSGGTSSFGPAVSATGGTSATPSGVNGAGTVSVGTALKTGYVAIPFINNAGSIGLLFGETTRPAPAPATAIAYSTSGLFIAGAAAAGGSTVGGVGGAIVVEFVG
jgi:hypothetical protein